MWLKRLAHYLLEKRLNAIWVVLVLSLLPPVFAALAVVIVGLVTLHRGVKEGFLLLLWALLPYVVKAFISGTLLLVVLPLVNCVGIWLSALILRWYASWTVVIRYLGLFGVVCVALLHLAFPNIADFWAKHLMLYMQQLTHLLNIESVEPALIAEVALVATGMQALLFLGSLCIKLMMARWWQARVFNPGGLRKELYQIRVETVTVGLFFALALAIALQSNIALDAIVPLCGVFIAAGLSLLHCGLKAHKYGFGLLVLFYLIAIFYHFVMVAPMMAAMVDKWVNFRSRIENQ